MRFRLGTETIISINDGGMGIRYAADNEISDWRPRPLGAFDRIQMMTVMRTCKIMMWRKVMKLVVL
jgi:hypothetical protein